MAQHKDLTGSDLHEPKGIASASANDEYVADGAGSGSWVTVRNRNKVYMTYTMPISNAANSISVPFTENMTVTKITGVISDAVTTATTVVTFSKNGAATLGTMSIVVAGSARGTTYTVTPASNNTFVGGDHLQCNAAAGTAAARTLSLLIEATLT